MLIIVVFVILTIFFTVIVAKNNQASSEFAKSLAIAIPTQFFGILFVIILLVAPAKWGEVRLDAEHDLIPFVTSDGNEYYGSLNGGSYTFYLDNNRPTTIKTNEVTSIVYIKEDEAPKLCRYIQKDEWTWYAPPSKPDIVTYILYLYDGSIIY